MNLGQKISFNANSSVYILDDGTWFDFATAATTRLRISRTSSIVETGTIRPMVDAAFSCGSPSSRWSAIYATTGMVSTSDDREKTYIDITDVEKQVALNLKDNMRKFKFNDAIATKGADKARIHFGASAQTVKAIFEEFGLKAEDYGMFCYDQWPEEPEVVNDAGKIIKARVPAGGRFGLRYEELLSFIISAM